MRAEKIKMHAVHHILAHNSRGAPDRPRNIKNENIKPHLSHLNYNLANEIQPKPAYEYYKKRLSEIYVHGNADVGLVSWLITAPKTLPEDEYEKFFKSAFDFFTKMHGEENVVSAYVHMDETTPHMHFCFIPIVNSVKKGEKLCAKEVTTQSYLKKAHPAAEKYISDELGHHVELINGATKEGNKSLEDFKRGKAKEDLENAKKEAEKIVSEAIETAEAIIKDYEVVSSVYENKKEFIENVEALTETNEEIYGVEEHEPTPDDPEHYFKVPADVWYRQKISKDMVEIYKESQDKAIQYADKLVEYEQRNRKLISENITLSEKLEQAKTEKENHEKWIIKFKTALRKLAERIPNFKKIFKEVAEEVDAEEKAAKEHNRYVGERDFRTDPEH